MKTYSFDEAKAIVDKKIQQSVVTLRRQLRSGKKKLADRQSTRAYVSRSV